MVYGEIVNAAKSKGISVNLMLLQALRQFLSHHGRVTADMYIERQLASAARNVSGPPIAGAMRAWTGSIANEYPKPSVGSLRKIQQNHVTGIGQDQKGNVFGHYCGAWWQLARRGSRNRISLWRLAELPPLR